MKHFSCSTQLSMKFKLLINIDEAVLMCPPNICFEQKYENSQKIHLKIVIFTAVKNRCILHGRVFVMDGNLLKSCLNSVQMKITQFK